jgi:hypothetical protein
MHRVLKPEGVLVFGGMSRSLQTRLSLWWHTALQRDRSPRLFDWRMGVTPAEMKRLSEEAGFNMVHEELQGVCDVTEYSLAWGNFPRVVQVRHVGSRACKDTGKHYLGWAYKQPPAADAAGAGQANAAQGHQEL